MIKTCSRMHACACRCTLSYLRTYACACRCTLSYLRIEWHLNSLPDDERLALIGLKHALPSLLHKVCLSACTRLLPYLLLAYLTLDPPLPPRCALAHVHVSFLTYS